MHHTLLMFKAASGISSSAARAKRARACLQQEAIKKVNRPLAPPYKPLQSSIGCNWNLHSARSWRDAPNITRCRSLYLSHCRHSKNLTVAGKDSKGTCSLDFQRLLRGTTPAAVAHRVWNLRGQAHREQVVLDPSICGPVSKTTNSSQPPRCPRLEFAVAGEEPAMAVG